MPHFADILFSFTELIKNNHISSNLSFINYELEDFNAISQKLAEVSTLPNPDSSCMNYHIVSHSSADTVAASSYQIIHGIPESIGFFLMKLSEP